MSECLARARILLVEDEPLIGMMAHALLAEHGAEVDWVQTDREAYRMIEANASSIHLLITDINLREGTTGFDISRFARRLSSSMPVIYVSGEQREALVNFAVEGATFLCKPVAEAVLLQAVEQALSNDSCPLSQPVSVPVPRCG
jgi:DNA-binding response OmpR family regulator